MEEEVEEWRDVVGYEGLYKISTKASVVSYDRTAPYVNKNGFVINKFHPSLVMKPNVPKDGYPRVQLVGTDHKKTAFLLHRLVALTFLPNPDNLPDVNHKDSIKTNCFLDNLEWCSKSYNIKYSYDHGNHKRMRGEFNGFSKYKENEVIMVRKLYSEGVKIPDISRMLNMPYQTTYSFAKGRNWKHLL